MEWQWVAVVAAAAVLATTWYMLKSKSDDTPVKYQVGGITLETLAQYSGYDFTKPILLAIKGRVYEVTKAADQYAPGKPLHAYAGKEIARALALGSTSPSDCGSAVLHDLNQEAAERLQAAEADYSTRFDLVGEVVPMRELTLAQLSKHDGVALPGAPLLLAIQGTVFDVSRGSQFYGPEGVYPFAGRECARALALMSTDLSDCHDRVDDLGYVEKENLREWAGKFTFKYPIVGTIVAAPADGAAAATAASS